jgi:hypothetical protein
MVGVIWRPIGVLPDAVPEDVPVVIEDPYCLTSLTTGVSLLFQAGRLHRHSTGDSGGVKRPVSFGLFDLWGVLHLKELKRLTSLHGVVTFGDGVADGEISPRHFMSSSLAFSCRLASSVGLRALRGMVCVSIRV